MAKELRPSNNDLRKTFDLVYRFLWLKVKEVQKMCRVEIVHKSKIISKTSTVMEETGLAVVYVSKNQGYQYKSMV